MSDKLIGLGVAILGTAILVLALQLPQPLAATRIAYGAGFFPTVLGVIIALAGLYMALFSKPEEGEPEDEGEQLAWANIGRPAIVAGAALVYILFSQQLGFLVLAPIILTGMLLLGRVEIWRSLLIGIVGSLAIYFLFAKLLLVPLPMGILTPFGGFL